MKRLALVAIFSTACSFAQQWQASPKSDPLTGKAYTVYLLTGEFLTPPAHGEGKAPMITLRCDPSPNHGRISGRLLDGFIVVNAVIDTNKSGLSTVQYRLDDGKLQNAGAAVGDSTDYQAISLEGIFVNNLLWGHMIPHKSGKGDQVHKVVVAVQEHLAGQIVMQFDMPDAKDVAAGCGTEYK